MNNSSVNDFSEQDKTSECGAGDDRVGDVLCGHVVVCEETGACVHRGLQPARADNGSIVRRSGHARAAPSRKVP